VTGGMLLGKWPKVPATLLHNVHFNTGEDIPYSISLVAERECRISVKPRGINRRR